MIYSTDTLRLKWGIHGNSLYKRITYHIQTGKLYRIRNGIFTDVPLKRLSQEDLTMIAAMSVQPGYLSFETILSREGIISQYSGIWYVATPTVSRDTRIVRLAMDIRREHVPEEIFYQQIGIIHTDGYSRATPERAIADTLGRSPLYHFDVLPRTLDLTLLSTIATLWKDISSETSERIMSMIDRLDSPSLP